MQTQEQRDKKIVHERRSNHALTVLREERLGVVHMFEHVARVTEQRKPMATRLGPCTLQVLRLEFAETSEEKPLGVIQRRRPEVTRSEQPVDPLCSLRSPLVV